MNGILSSPRTILLKSYRPQFKIIPGALLRLRQVFNGQTRKEWAEVLLIVLVGAAYALDMLNLDPNLAQAGNEYQAHVGFMGLFNQWLSGESEFPLWNPIAGYGRSLIADPFLFIFNPFVSGPMALLGIVNGTKVAVALNFLIAGLGMWILSRLLGFERPARLWSSLLYMMAGAIPSHLTAGQIQLASSLGWLPWSIATAIWAIRSRKFIAIVLAAFAQALFFFTGNLYYQLYAGFTLLIIGIVLIVDWKRARIRIDAAKSFLLVAMFSFGLIAVQFLPMVAAQSSIRNSGGFLPGDDEFPGSQRPEYAILNYFVADPDFLRDPVLEKVPIIQEDYRYVGIAPFLLLLFLVPSARKGNRREIIAIAASFAFLLAWASLKYSFVAQIYDLFPVLFQFRFPGRALSVGGLFLILLSGYGLDHLWRTLRSWRRARRGEAARPYAMLRRYAASMGAVLLVVGLILGLRRVYVENRNLIDIVPFQRPEIALAVDRLLEMDQTNIAIGSTYTITDGLTIDAYENSIRLIDFNDGWRPQDAPYTVGASGILQLAAPIFLDWEWDQAPQSGYSLIDQIGELRIWQVEGTYPYAFMVPFERLISPAEIAPEEVMPTISSERRGPNTIVIDLEADVESILVITEAWFDGWKVDVDGRPSNVVSVSNLLAVPIPEGSHQVTFSYSPSSFKVGLLISSFTIIIIAWFAISSLVERFLQSENKAS
ncbi:MAG: YfhO family protein [Anaerolineales bacterium]